MNKSDYITPDKTWLVKEFENIPFDVLRPAELEISIVSLVT
jgi:hypothetical protein